MRVQCGGRVFVARLEREGKGPGQPASSANTKQLRLRRPASPLSLPPSPLASCLLCTPLPPTQQARGGRREGKGEGGRRPTPPSPAARLAACLACPQQNGRRRERVRQPSRQTEAPALACSERSSAKSMIADSFRFRHFINQLTLRAKLSPILRLHHTYSNIGKY